MKMPKFRRSPAPPKETGREYDYTKPGDGHGLTFVHMDEKNVHHVSGFGPDWGSCQQSKDTVQAIMRVGGIINDWTVFDRKLVPGDVLLARFADADDEPYTGRCLVLTVEYYDDPKDMFQATLRNMGRQSEP